MKWETRMFWQHWSGPAWLEHKIHGKEQWEIRSDADWMPILEHSKTQADDSQFYSANGGGDHSVGYRSRTNNNGS